MLICILYTYLINIQKHPNLSVTSDNFDGAMLWYDFIYNNPRNPDVEDISVGELKALFPDSYITYKKVTLTPPISRSILSVAPWNWIYSCFNLPFLRTHIVAWIQKTLINNNSLKSLK